MDRPEMAVCRIVDDFGIVHCKDSDFMEFVDMLKKLYETVVYEINCKQFLGFDIKTEGHGTKEKTVSISIIGYVEEMMMDLEYEPSKWQTDSPGTYVPPKFGYNEQQEAILDSPPISAAEAKWMQKVLGKCLYYGRAVDITILLSCNKIATNGFNEDSLAATKRMLDYLASHPTATVVYKRSDMILKGVSDASFDSETNSRSRYAGVLYFGNKDDSPTDGPPAFMNGNVNAYTKVFTMITTSASATEYGSLFELGREAEETGDICKGLKVEQFCSPLWTDNTTAVKLAHNMAKGKRSKTVARQHNWLAQQVKLGRFSVHWESGKTIVADPLTKFVPVHMHRIWANKMLHYPLATAQMETQRIRRIKRAKSGIEDITKIESHRVERV